MNTTPSTPAWGMSRIPGRKSGRGWALFSSLFLGGLCCPLASQAQEPPAAQSAQPDPTLEEMERRLQEMGARLDDLNQEVTRTSSESRELVQQALTLVRRSKEMESGSAAGAVAPVAAVPAVPGVEGVPAMPSAPEIGEDVLPPEAVEVLNTVQQTLDEALTEALDGLSPEQQAELARAKAELAVQLDQMSAEFNASDFGQHNSAWRRELELRLRRAERELAARANELQKEGRSEQLSEARSRRSAEPDLAAAERTVFTGNSKVSHGEVVKEFVLFSGNGEIEGEVEGDAVILAGNLVVRKGAYIGGDAVVLAGNLEVEDGAVVSGDAVVTAGKLKVEDGAVVGGDTVEMKFGPLAQAPMLHKLHISLPHVPQVPAPPAVPEPAVEDEEESRGLSTMIGDVVLHFVLLWVSGLLLLLFMPERTRGVGRVLGSRPAAAAVTGALVSLSALPLMLLLAVSLVGLPLVPVVAAGLAFALVMGVTAAAIELGRLLPLHKHAPIFWLTGGAAFIAVMGEVPILGVLGLIALGVTGVGAVMLSRFGGNGASVNA